LDHRPGFVKKSIVLDWVTSEEILGLLHLSWTAVGRPITFTRLKIIKSPTDVDRTVGNCFKYRNKIGLDVALEALRDGWAQRKFTMEDIWHFATVDRVANVMRPYLESVTT